MEQFVGFHIEEPTMRSAASTSLRKPARRRAADVQCLVRTRDLEARGTSRAALRRLVIAGEWQQVARGLYVPSGFEPTEHHGLAAAAALVPGAIVCLLSALQFHGLGTQAPFEVWLAVDRKARKPSLAYPPVRIVRFSGAGLRANVEDHVVEGVRVRITSAARAVVDCFRYRNKIGLDVALDALRAYRRARFSLDDLARAAATMRAANVMRPYLEATAS